MFAIAAEIEVLRLGTYNDILQCDRESTTLLVQHIKHLAVTDDKSIGVNVIFSSASIPDGSGVLSSSNGFKAIKRIQHLLLSSHKDDTV